MDAVVTIENEIDENGHIPEGRKVAIDPDHPLDTSDEAFADEDDRHRLLWHCYSGCMCYFGLVGS